jgi:uncharacterized damage-inducible protein DinB
MGTTDLLLAEFDREAAATRTLLSRVPENQFSWRPHQKSFTAGELVSHIANLPFWALVTLTESSFDTAGQPQTPAATSQGELLARFDGRVAEARAALAAVSEEQLAGMWTLTQGNRTLFSMPRLAVWRSFVMNHLIHHRGQLSVYLRLLDRPVPSIYGPSADEAPRF